MEMIFGERYLEVKESDDGHTVTRHIHVFLYHIYMLFISYIQQRYTIYVRRS